VKLLRGCLLYNKTHPRETKEANDQQLGGILDETGELESCIC